MMFGYATEETAEPMPRPIVLAHALARRLADVRRSGAIQGLRPDGKTQVTIRYENGVPVKLERNEMSTQHAPGIDQDDLRDAVLKDVVVPLIFDDCSSTPQQHADHLRPVRRLRSAYPVAHECERVRRRAQLHGGARRDLGEERDL